METAETTRVFCRKADDMDRCGIAFKQAPHLAAHEPATQAALAQTCVKIAEPPMKSRV
jgi:hypothetical protein